VALATAASVTERILLGTGVVLVAQHDPIVLAKQLATLDRLSGGRVVFGMGFGWNREEAADHGVAFATASPVAREHVLCMQALWSEEEAEFHGDHVDLDRCWSWPKPVQQPRMTTLVGGGLTLRCSQPSPSTPTVGSPSAVRAGRLPAPPSAVPSRSAGRDPGPDPGGPLRDRSHRRTSWPTTSPWGSTRWCSGCRREAPTRCWRCSTTTAYLERFGGDDG
jgi:hypothetical protein